MVEYYTEFFRDFELRLQNCFNFISIWMLVEGTKGVFHIGLVFCR